MPTTLETAPPAPPASVHAGLDAVSDVAEEGSQETAQSRASSDALDVPLDSSLAALQDDAGPVDLLLSDLVTSVEPPRATSAERAAYRASRKLRRGGEGRPVLVVDAAPIARKFLVQRLQALGYEAQAAENGEGALALIRQQAFAIVFLELAFGPDSHLDGLELCQTVKQQCARSGDAAPAFVITTGQAGSAHRVRGSLAGCDAFLNKPLVDAEFLASLREVDPLFR